MPGVDGIVLAVAGRGALTGLRRGLVATALSFGGLIAGAVVGARVAPHLLHGGADSPYTPLAGPVRALVGAALLQWVAGGAGSFAPGGAARLPPPPPPGSAGGGRGRPAPGAAAPPGAGSRPPLPPGAAR